MNNLQESKPAVYKKVQKYGMRIVRLEYDYTCNFRYVHCDIHEYQKKSDRRAFTIPDVVNLADQADQLGFSQFVISGGEPMFFRDFDAIVNAIDPARFYITTDTNGWMLDRDRARELKAIGVDKVQVSIDSLYTNEHDKFRQKSGSWHRAIDAVKFSKEAGLSVLVQTVVDKQRAHSEELIKFFEYFNAMDVPVCILYAKPVGNWKGRMDLILTQDDIAYVEGLARKHNIFSHLTPTGGCIAVKRMINIMKWGDVNPCPVMQEYSLGNFFDEPLSVIVKRGEAAFGHFIPTCLMACDQDFIEQLERYGKKISD